MQRTTLALVAFVLLATAGCRTVATAPEGLKPREVYQEIANQLPEADLGWGDPPIVARMAASERGRPPETRPDLSCDEHRMKIVIAVLDSRVWSVPYNAIEDVTYTYCLFPNLPFCIMLPVIQLSEVRVVFDAKKVDGLFPWMGEQCTRLERISPEIGMSGPYDHAQAVRMKVRDDAKDFGEGRLSFTFSFTTPIPPFIPYTGKARHVAEQFAWVKQHPDEPLKDPSKDPSPPK